MDTSGNPYPFDFLETLVGISFPVAGGYVLISITAIASALGTTPPPPPTVLLQLPLGGKAKLIDKQESNKTKTTPAKTTITKLFFAWSALLPLPTVNNYNTVVVANIDPPIQYANQFANITITNTQTTNPINLGVEPPPEGGDGYFSTAAIAQGYVNSWNGHIGIADHGGAFGIGGIVNGSPSPVSVKELDVPITTPATSTTTLTGKYLVKIPADLTTFTATVTAGPGGTSTLLITGFHGAAPTKVAQVNLANSDSDAAASANGTTKTYTMTSVVATKPPPPFTTVTAVAGGSAG